MQELRWPLAVFVALAGCSGTPDDDFACHLADREGTYLVHYVEQAHADEPMCGPLADTLGRPDDPSAVIVPDWGTCRIESSSLHNDACDFELVYGCSNDEKGTATSLVEVTQQKDQSGDRIEGLLTRIVYQPDGAGCRSDYAVTARRQRAE